MFTGARREVGGTMGPMGWRGRGEGEGRDKGREINIANDTHYALNTRI